jgi:hypothetical protein
MAKDNVSKLSAFDLAFSPNEGRGIRIAGDGKSFDGLRESFRILEAGAGCGRAAQSASDFNSKSSMTLSVSPCRATCSVCDSSKALRIIGKWNKPKFLSL